MGGELLKKDLDSSSTSLDWWSSIEGSTNNSKKRLTTLLAAVAFSTASITWEALAWEKNSWNYDNGFKWEVVVSNNEYVTPKEIPNDIKKALLDFKWDDRNWDQLEEYEKFERLFATVNDFSRYEFLDEMEIIINYDKHLSSFEEVQKYIYSRWYPTNNHELITLWAKLWMYV